MDRIRAHFIDTHVSFIYESVVGSPVATPPASERRSARIAALAGGKLVGTRRGVVSDTFPRQTAQYERTPMGEEPV
jgi:hypothetical protein